MKWYRFLCGGLSKDEQPRVVTNLLRWSKESILVAAPLLLQSRLSTTPALEQLLKACTPADPRAATDSDFVAYRKPAQCLENTFKNAGEKFSKSREGEDLLEEIGSSKPAREAVYRRVPDLARLVQFLGPMG